MQCANLRAARWLFRDIFELHPIVQRVFPNGPWIHQLHQILGKLGAMGHHCRCISMHGIHNFYSSVASIR